MPYFYVGSEGGEEFVQEQQTAFKLDREINSVLATDCGSTTTKAILIAVSYTHLDVYKRQLLLYQG